MASYIGTYGEKTLHRELKWHLEPTGAFHEAPVGKYIADIKTESGVIEIQTQSFGKLRPKLIALLQEHTVTLVYPVTREKQLIWIDKENGEVLRTRRSPKRGSFYDAFRELYYIKTLLTNANLILRLVLMDVTERRTEAVKWRGRRGYHKIDTAIRSICDELTIADSEDYLNLVPRTLDEPFTSRDYAACAGLNMRNAGIALNILFYVGAVKRVGKSGNSYLYERRGD